MYLATPELLEEMLSGSGAKDALDGGFLYVFAGPVPATAAEALDMVTLHTQLAMLSVDNDGVTGLTFAAATGGLLTKTEAEVWQGTVTFDGAEDDAEEGLAPTFFRFCPSGDDGRGVATGPRLQGTAGGPSSGADYRLGADTVVDNGTNTIGAAIFELGLASLGA